MEQDMIPSDQGGNGQKPAIPEAIMNIPGLQDFFIGKMQQTGGANLAKDLMTMGPINRQSLDYLLRSDLTMEELQAICHFHATRMAIKDGRVDWDAIMLLYIVGKASIGGQARKQYLQGIVGGPIRAVRSTVDRFSSAFKRNEAQVGAE